MSEQGIFLASSLKLEAKVVRSLVEDDLQFLKSMQETIESLEIETDSLSFRLPSASWTENSAIDPSAARLFHRLERFIDILLEPEKAESAIANLDELYRRRLELDGGHAKRWLIAQVGWIVFGRGMELLRMFSAARAGK
jgi:hypothetical protein